MTERFQLGVCYFPEHWPEDRWAEDARAMASLGLDTVRIGEFAWSRIEPAPGEFQWGWLDRAMDTLHEARLGIVLCTPTATPPKWLIDAYPDVLAFDREGRPRKFGSRRHYCFSSVTYRREAARITDAIARRYGTHPGLVAWQTDNEYGCHDTVRSYSPMAEAAFRRWLAARYDDVSTLNKAWGNVFWSMEYRSFEEVDLPNLTVTEPNPSHVLDFYRFSSDQVISFNRMKSDILRQHAPDIPVSHNFMGFFTDFDHFRLSEDLDIATWDSYPLGFLDIGPFTPEEKKRYLRQGHPDMAAFHHDLYRACKDRWWVMEQQPGPVNWARHNPAPLAGTVRNWTWEAFAHGAETVSYFRWRQAPFAQEQMHAGLLRPDGGEAAACDDVRKVVADRQEMTPPETPKATVALMFSYDARWMFEAQPQEASWDYWKILLAWYGAARRLSLDIDIIHPESDLSGYELVLIPPLPFMPDTLIEQMKQSPARFLIGPRSGSKTGNLQIPPDLPPGPLQGLLSLKVTAVESLPADIPVNATYQGKKVTARLWREFAETDLEPLVVSGTGQGLGWRQGNLTYLGTMPDEEFLTRLITDLASEASLETCPLEPDLRLRRRDGLVFAFNFGTAPLTVPEALRRDGETPLFGSWEIAPADCCCWEDRTRKTS